MININKELYKLFIVSSLLILETFNFKFFNFNLRIKKPIDSSIINFIKLNNINNIRIKNNEHYLILRYLHEPNEILFKNNDKDNKDNKNIKIIDNEFNDMINVVNYKNYNNDNKIYNNFYEIINKNYEDYEKNENENNNIINYNNEYYNKNSEKDNNVLMNIINFENNYETENYNIYDIIKKNEKPIIISYEKKNKNKTLEYKYSYLIRNSTSYLTKYTLCYNNKNYRYEFDINASEIDSYETNWNIKSKFNERIDNDITRTYIKNWIEYNLNNNNKFYYYKKYLLFNYYYNKYLY